MSVAKRFAKLLSAAIDPESYHAIKIAAQERVKTLDDCLMEIAETSLDRDMFTRLRSEAEAREAQAEEMSAASRKQAEAPPSPPASAELNHVQVRLQERYSLGVSKQEIQEIEGLIQSGSAAAKLVKQEAEVIKHYEVQIKGKNVRVVYSPKKGCVLTAVPLRPYQKPANRVRGGKPDVGWAAEAFSE